MALYRDTREVDQCTIRGREDGAIEIVWFHENGTTEVEEATYLDIDDLRAFSRAGGSVQLEDDSHVDLDVEGLQGMDILRYALGLIDTTDVVRCEIFYDEHDERYSWPWIFWRHRDGGKDAESLVIHDVARLAEYQRTGEVVGRVNGREVPLSAAAFASWEHLLAALGLVYHRGGGQPRGARNDTIRTSAERIVPQQRA